MQLFDSCLPLLLCPAYRMTSDKNMAWIWKNGSGIHNGTHSHCIELIWQQNYWASKNWLIFFFMAAPSPPLCATHDHTDHWRTIRTNWLYSRIHFSRKVQHALETITKCKTNLTWGVLNRVTYLCFSSLYHFLSLYWTSNSRNYDAIKSEYWSNEFQS